MLLLHNGHYVVCLKETVREYIRAKSVGSRGLGWVRAGGGVQFYMKWSGKPQCQGGFEQRVTGGERVSLWSGYWENWENDLETEYGDDELIDCIQKWIREHTVRSTFNLTDQTENFAQFEQVRIPIYDKNGSALDARAFATSLRKYLAKTPYNITSKILVRGLGEAVIILGEK